MSFVYHRVRHPLEAPLADALAVVIAPMDQRRRAADRVFRGCLLYTSALTLFWLFIVVARRPPGALFSRYDVDLEALRNVFFGFLFFSVFWGLVWYGIKNLLLWRLAGFTKEERRLAFSSRMHEPFDLQALLARHSERRIRIVDMIGRRGRFMTLQLSFFYYLYTRIAAEPTPAFLTLALQDSLFDAVVLCWAAIALYYSNGFLARLFYGAQSRVMDGALARANCLLITTLWSAFRFVMVPIGMQLARHFPPSTYAALFVLIWGSYVAADAASEVVGSLFGKQKLRVWGLGDVNRKSIAGTWGGFLASLLLCLSVVAAQGLPLSWMALAVVVSLSSTFFELVSPRGTDDFTMATANALVCWVFGSLVY